MLSRKPLDRRIKSLAKLHDLISPRDKETLKNKKRLKANNEMLSRISANDDRPMTIDQLHHFRCLLLKLLCLIMRSQRINNRLQLPVHYLLELMNGETDAVVG